MPTPDAAPAVSVVIRAKDEAAAIGHTLELLARQTISDRIETIVVDSGSSDETVAIARRYRARVIEIPASSFTFGGALNTGAEAARAPIVAALSAHAFPRTDDWLERVLAAFADDRVAAVSGCWNAPEGGPMQAPLVQDEDHARRFPNWGYSNVSGAFRRALWEQRRFRADMPSSEDREWAWHWLRQGHLVFMDPDLRVDQDHSHDPLREIYARYWRYWRGYTMYLELPPYRLRELAHEWWSDRQGWPNHLRARLSPRRAARLFGKFAGLSPTRR